MPPTRAGVHEGDMRPFSVFGLVEKTARRFGLRYGDIMEVNTLRSAVMLYYSNLEASVYQQHEPF